MGCCSRMVLSMNQRFRTILYCAGQQIKSVTEEYVTRAIVVLDHPGTKFISLKFYYISPSFMLSRNLCALSQWDDWPVQIGKEW